MFTWRARVRPEGIVSRDKLLEMKRNAEDMHSDGSKAAIFTRVKFPRLFASCVVSTFEMWGPQGNAYALLEEPFCGTVVS